MVRVDEHRGHSDGSGIVSTFEGFGGSAWGWLGRLLLIPALVATHGCTEVTWWDARGSWRGEVTLPGEAEVQRTGGLSDATAGQTDDRIALCELTTIEVGLTFVPIQRDRPAAIEVRTARPLCQEGEIQITGGAVLIWANPPGDPNVLRAVRSDAWTVAGQIEVASYLSQGLPDLDAGETADTERVEGTFRLTATDATGAVLHVDGGTFDLTVIASRVKRSIS